MQDIFPNEQEKTTLLTQLNLLGAKKVRVEFQGGGDSGQVEYVGYQDKNDEWNTIPDEITSWTKQTYGSQEPQQERISLDEVLEDLCYRALDKTGLDWYNNDGGQGALVIDFTKSPTLIKLDVGVNYTTTEDHEFVIDGDDDDDDDNGDE